MDARYGEGVFVCSARHENTISWSVSNPDDVNYQIDIDVARNFDGDTWTSLVTGLSTYDTQYVHPEWGIVADGGGAVTKYWNYRVKVMPKVGGAAVDTHAATSQIVKYNTRSCEYRDA